MNPPPRPDLFARSRIAQKADDAIAAMWRRGWTKKPPLDPDFLWAEGAKGYDAADEFSLRSEADVEDFRIRLERLCRSLYDEARLNALGWTMAYGQLKGAIRSRHALGRLWRMRPELASTKIAAPIIVLGQMRSGTTRVQRLLAADPRHSGTRFCDSHDPVPSTPDIRPFRARATLFLARKVNPWLDTFHPFGPTRTDEEIGWLAAALSPASFEAQWHIPGFVAFSEARDPAPIYREFARILRTDAAVHGTAERPRILKCPQFSEDLLALLKEFPEVRVVHCQREDEATLASSVSMVASQRAYQSDVHSPDGLRKEWERKMARREDASAQALSDTDCPIATLSFQDLNERPHEALRRAYADIGLTYDDSARNAVARELALAEKEHHRKHRKQIARLAPQLRGSKSYP